MMEVRGKEGCKSHLASLFTLANSPGVMQNSRESDTATVWFDILDSQSGATAKRLVGSSFQFGSLSCFIRVAKAHPGTLLCQHCWRWGHSTKACCSQAPRCPQCSGPHTEANHRSLAGCCQGNPSANPPQPATPEGAPCPHTAHCVNCEGKHSAANRQCPYWRHHFDRAWLSSQIALALDRANVDPALQQLREEMHARGRKRGKH
jgi:hypothetical protein